MIDSAWLDWYRARHDQRCLDSGESFENYVTEVLKRFHPDYLNPTPMGRSGDWGCDGLADNGAILYACYGQRAATDVDRKTKNKLENDLARAVAHWESFSTWRFVTNAPLGPLPMKALLEQRKKHGPESERPIALEYWTPDDLWRKAVSHLSEMQLREIMPGVPHAQNVELSDLVQLIESLEAIEIPSDALTSSIRPVSPLKMEYNKLPADTQIVFNEARRLSPRIDKWFSEQPDPELRDKKARRFRVIYEEARNVTSKPGEIIQRLYVALGGSNFALSQDRANAVYAVTVYFFDSCDIFEEPDAEGEGGEWPYVAPY